MGLTNCPVPLVAGCPIADDTLRASVPLIPARWLLGLRVAAAPVKEGYLHDRLHLSAPGSSAAL